MKFIVKLFSEIMIKSKSVRIHFIKILVKNISCILKKINKNIRVISNWDNIEILYENNLNLLIIQKLINIPGIHQILLVKEQHFTNVNDICENTMVINHNRLLGKSFCVRVKRKGQHKFTSCDIERYVGAAIKKNIKDSYVDLVNPDEVVLLEINFNSFFIVLKCYKGLGGFPIGTQESVLLLISGGFDSGVSSYMLARRGCKVNYCFFNIGGISHEIGTRKIAHHLWSRFGSSHKVRFFSINFIPVVNEIIHKIYDKQMGIVLKRMMIRTASSIAKNFDIPALVTGDSLGQVSSQTLTNLSLIDNVSNIMILRPLITFHKEKIVSLARYINIENMVNEIPEYCSLLSNKATAKSSTYELKKQEENFDFAILDKVMMQIDVMDIRDVIFSNNLNILHNIKVVHKIDNNNIILDIRSQEEQENKPLILGNGIKVISMPYYKLIYQFSSLDPKKLYILYCDQGLLSNLQAYYLRSKGFNNVKVFHPDILE